jgi:hypothetical protein
VCGSICVCVCVKANVCYCDSQGFDLVPFCMLYWLCVAILQHCMYSKAVCTLRYYITKYPTNSDHVRCPLKTSPLLLSCSRVTDNQTVAYL